MELHKVVISVIASLATLLNLHALYFLCKKKRRNNYIILCINLSICDLVQSIIGFTITIFLKTDLKTPSDLCKLAAFFVFFPGLTSIFLLTSIALTRLLLPATPFLTRKLRYTMLFKVIGPFAWIYALFWSVLPLIGVSSYTLDATHARCSIKWITTTITEKSYVISLLIFCYIAPVIIITTSSFALANLIHRKMKYFSTVLNLRSAERKLYRSREYKAKLSLGLMCLSFLICWTPYAVTAALSTLMGGQLPKYMYHIGALFAKLTSIFNPIIIYWRRDLPRILGSQYSRSKSTFILSVEKKRNRLEAGK